MKSVVFFAVGYLIAALQAEYVPQYLKTKYNSFSPGSLSNGGSYSQSGGNVKTISKTSYGKSKTNSGYGKSHNNGGCTGLPATPMNAGIRCSQFSGCRAQCFPNYQFPNGQTEITMICTEGKWQIQDADRDWDIVPACEPTCLPNCLNNGICMAPNQCNCPENFSGPQCQFESKPCLNYPPMPLNAKRTCRSNTCTISCMNGHRFPDGSAITTMSCNSGNWQPTRVGWVTIPDCQPTCNPPCLNGGNCLSFNVCQCPQEFRGSQCQYGVDVCNAKKLTFNGGYNCSGSADTFSCSLSCPAGIEFEFQPATKYSCTYDTGVFLPSPIPQCIYSDNMEVIPLGGSSQYHSTFYNSSSSTSSGSKFNTGSHNSGNYQWSATTTSDEVESTNYNQQNKGHVEHGMNQNQFIVVEEKKPTPGVCFTWSGSHYKTFDGKLYSFQSDCAHTLVRDAVDDTFSVVVQNNPKCGKNRGHCDRIIKFYLQDRQFTLKKSDEGLAVFSSPKKTLPLPGQLPGIRAEIIGHFVVISLDTVGAKIKWDTNQLVQVEVTEALWNRTAGLCGNIDGDIRNDLVTKDGVVPRNIHKLASSWQVDYLGEECNSVPNEEHGCERSSDILKTEAATEFCSKLLSDARFHPCTKVMDITELLTACKWDYCACKEQDPKECACNTVNVYVRGCAHSGIKTLANWRDDNTCPMRCTGGRTYMQCAPSGGQAVCGAAVESPTSDTAACEEGCYCPTGTVLHENRCITRDKCPCRLRGKEFAVGTSIPKDCNTCTCASGQWICTQVSCGARCAAIGDPHYITFDGKRFDFMGQCSYYLVKHDNFSIEAENVACSGAISQAMNFPVSVSAGLPSCTKTVTIKMNGQTIHLKQNHELVINGKNIMKIPFKAADIKIRSVSSIFMIVELPNDIEIWWDGVSRVYIDVPASLKYLTKGLCGTFNDNQKDDFLTPENDVEQSVVPFANKWKTDEKCNDIPDKLLSHPCNVNIQKKAAAEEHCKKLKSQIFGDCHWFVDPEPYYQDCLYDMCSCETKVSQCLCPIIASYAQDCTLHSTTQLTPINWRESIHECGVQCTTPGQTYQVCGDSCARTCYDLATRTECKSRCVEGCNCPAGETLDEYGECVGVGRCRCQHEGLEFPPGYKEVRPGSKGLNLCTCTNAAWNCKRATDAEVKKYPKASDLKAMCDSFKNFEFTTCESVEPTTCKNMHKHELTSASVCHAGCQCKEGYVLDSKNRVCVKPEECPCQHGGRSYKENAEVQSDCNTCKCKNGKWDCTDRQCSAECSAWGDSHFKTFDGKMYDYQGQCDYVLAKGVLSDDNSFDISIQNVPCGTLGVSCSKSLTIKIGSSVQQEKIVLTQDKAVPAEQIFKRFTVRNRDLFVIVEAYDLGLIVMWDKGTRVYVKLDPRWKNKVKGLCGNYNDNEIDDFQTPSGGFTEASAQIFGDSWKLQSYCPEAVEILDTCAERPERKMWALKQCGVLKSSPFSLCHTEVPVDPYLERCVFDSCACDKGGDCECLCTALAAYAQECNNRGIPIKWRSQHLCPIQCDERCANYAPCVSTCPPTTCDNLLLATPLSRLCSQDSCVEGCAPRPCPPGHVYRNNTLGECVPAVECRPVCMEGEVEGEVFYEGDVVTEDACHRCHCSRGQKSCKGQPCPVTEPTEPPAVNQHDALLECKSGWTEWINQDTFDRRNTSKIEVKIIDVEPMPDRLLMNSLKQSRCPRENMTDIKCRSVGKHIHYKEAHDNVECSIENGLICTGSDKNPCPDFEISVKCSCYDEITTVPDRFLTTVSPDVEDCTDKVEYKDDLKDCSKFYHCDPSPFGMTYAEKTCGEHMMFNPTTNNCDWPQNVIKIKPSCQEYLTTPPPIDNGTCEAGSKFSECGYQCDRMCIDYLHTVKALGICIEGAGQQCDSGCVRHDKPDSCPLGQLWASDDGCVPIHDCMCQTPDGRPVKPGSIIEQNECEVCQCVDNFYTCDTSACQVDIDSDGIPEEEREESSYHEHQSQHTSTASQTFSHNVSFVTHHETTFVISTVTPPKECHPDMYMDLIQGDSPLPDDALNASSVLGSYFSPINSRIDSQLTDLSAGSWSPLVSDKNQYLQITLPRQEPVYGIVIKGSPLYDQYVTSFKVLFSSDGAHFSYVEDRNKEPHLFRGSMDGNSPVKHMFYLPVEATIIRVNPQTWHDQIALRVELIGCGKLVTTTAVYEPTTTEATPVEECVDSMGYGEGLMSDQQVLVSSAKKNFDKKKININGEDGPWHYWQPITNSPTEYIQFNFLEPRNVTGFITKGGRHGWVTAFKVKYSHNNVIWNPILEDGNHEKVFPGNFDKDTAHTNKFPLPIMTQYVKIIPVKWIDNIQVRLEMLGCYKPYPEIQNIFTTPAPSPCNLCPGAPSTGLEMEACRCSADLWWDGATCVARPYCPCYIGHISYPVGTNFAKDDCSDCICKLSGVQHCTPKVCDKCEPGLRSSVSSTCNCLCLPCGEDKLLCPTSNICIDKSSWCNGVQDCPDDEINCEIQHIVTNTSIVESQNIVTLNVTKDAEVKCVQIKCPPGFKMIEKKLSPYEKLHSYVPTMFSTHGRKSYTKTYTPINGHKMKSSGGHSSFLDRPALPEKKFICPEYTCISKKPPPAYIKDKPCPSAACPDGYIPDFTDDTEETIKTHCPTYVCNPAPNRDSICNVTGKSFSTFDKTVYNYEICDHVLVRDLSENLWSIELKKHCLKTNCQRHLTIHHDTHSLTLHSNFTVSYDGFQYTVDQIKKIGNSGSAQQSFSITKLGNMLVFVSNRYGFWVMWIGGAASNDVKIGVSEKLLERVDGLCGYFNGVADDDKRRPNGDEAKTTEEFGDSWSVGGALESDDCAVRQCPEGLQNKALDMCKKVQSNVFAACSNVINIDAFLSRCMDSTCTCLETANGTQSGEDKCRCQMLQDFVVDCMSTDTSIELIDWRNIHDCPATCPSPLVYHDCYRRRCEPTCDSIADPNICPKLDAALCFPGCYCPPGLVRRGATCIPSSNCRDCECNVLPHLAYDTYDHMNYTVNGQCVYVMSRDVLERYHDTHKFQLLVTNAPCRDNPEKTCVGKITILHEGHKIHVFFDEQRNNLKLVVDSERIDDFEEVDDWATVRQTKSKHYKILMFKIQVEISVYFPSLGVSVKAPSHKYGGKLEGLCGDCNKYPDNDLRTPDGTQLTTADLGDFAASWLYDKLPGGQTREQCENIVEECEPLPIDSDPCVQLLDIERYGQCHPVLDPTMFVEWCKKESCGNRPEGACNAISAYGRECLNMGFCVHWHSDLCPAAKCPLGQTYQACGPSCTATCDTVLKPGLLTNCVNVPTDGCFCPEGKVRRTSTGTNGTTIVTCVPADKCEICDEIGDHSNGDKWKKDECTDCECVGTVMKCEKQSCPSVDKVCEYGYTAIKLNKEVGQCCEQFVCVPAATARPTCDPPQKLHCGADQILTLETTPDGCQRFICQCRPVDQCEPLSDTADLIPGMKRTVETSGCCPTATLACDESLCPTASVDCLEFYELVRRPVVEGECCARYECVPPKGKCIVELGYKDCGEEVAGEKERNVYEKQKLLKAINETWSDGPCRQCTCTPTTTVTCQTKTCSPLNTHPDYTEYELTPAARITADQCCPTYTRTACKYNDTVYQPGSKWAPIPGDECTRMECVEPKGKGDKVRRQVHVERCEDKMKQCQLGWEYVPAEKESGECCGQCVAVGCVVGGEGDGKVKRVGEMWESEDHCMRFECSSNNGTMQIQSEIVTCEQISQDKLIDFLYEKITIPGKCCPEHKMTACRVGSYQYQVGETWPSPDGNKCKTITCVEQLSSKYPKLIKQESIETCQTECAVGWEYVPSIDGATCCGQCEQVACVIELEAGDSHLYKAGEQWYSADNCTTFNCDSSGAGGAAFTVTSSVEACPDVSDCAEEMLYKKGCCRYCNVTALEQGQCTPEPMSAIKSIGIIKQNIPKHGLCLNKSPLKNFTECVGSCHSSTYFNIKSGKHESICACCTATKYTTISVVLNCEDGYTYKEEVSIPSVCSCEGCSAQKNPLLNGVKTY